MKNDITTKSELGRRIRERRKKLGITQAQLCGEYMTRNMLSRIETGDASPSLDTLLFIAQKLKMPPSYFLCRDTKEEAEYTKTVRIKDARRLLGTGQFKKCIDVCSELPSDDDEVSFIIVNAEIMMSLNDLDRGNLSDAKAHLENAQTALHQTVYMYSEMQSQIRVISLLIRSLMSGTPVSAKDLPDIPPVFFSRDRYFYVTALGLFDKDSLYPTPEGFISEKSVYKEHLTAKSLMEKGQYSDARIILEKIFNEAPDSYCQYFALLDLEECCRLSDDYKGAYTHAEVRMRLHDKYNNF